MLKEGADVAATVVGVGLGLLLGAGPGLDYDQGHDLGQGGHHTKEECEIVAEKDG